ncbi:hypothetical protein [Pseudoteredinibacter isoporae]|uniref:hypothetical protein n=1 Tax=Pseudoteredinibacter isoporae TaxID=570281 RepID=UPI00310A0EA6
MKQAICDCGRIAEVRRRSNGKHLRYLHCVKCGSNLGSAETAAKIEAIEQDDIGIKGEFPESAKPEIPKNSETELKVESAANPEPAPNDWKPEPQDMPEVLEPGPENRNISEVKTESSSGAESGQESQSGWSTWKLVAGICVSFVVGGGIYVACKGQS